MALKTGWSEEVEALRRELRFARTAVIALVPQVLWVELLKHVRGDWNKAQEALVTWAINDTDGQLYSSSGGSFAPRAMCPLCDSGPASERGHTWPRGLTEHLMKDCVVVKAIRGALSDPET